MTKRLMIAAVFMMLASIFVGGFSSQAATCRRVVLTIFDDPYFAHPICVDLPVGTVDVLLREVPTDGHIGLGDGVRPPH